MADSKDNVIETSRKGVQLGGPEIDLKNIQALLLNGLYPGNVAPAIIKSYQILEAMIQELAPKQSEAVKSEQQNEKTTQSDTSAQTEGTPVSLHVAPEA